MVSFSIDKTNKHTYTIECIDICICCYSVTSFVQLFEHGLKQARLPCPSLSPRVWSNSCPLSWRCHPTISSSVAPFSSCLQSFPASESFLMSQFFASGGQSIGTSALESVLPMNIQGWFRIDWFDLLAVQGTLRAFSNTTVQNHLFFRIPKNW